MTTLFHRILTLWRHLTRQPHTLRMACMCCHRELPPVACVASQANVVSHGICIPCLKEHYSEVADDVLAEMEKQKVA